MYISIYISGTYAKFRYNKRSVSIIACIKYTERSSIAITLTGLRV